MVRPLCLLFENGDVMVPCFVVGLSRETGKSLLSTALSCWIHRTEGEVVKLVFWVELFFFVHTAVSSGFQ